MPSGHIVRHVGSIRLHVILPFFLESCLFESTPPKYLTHSLFHYVPPESQPARLHHSDISKWPVYIFVTQYPDLPIRFIVLTIGIGLLLRVAVCIARYCTSKSERFLCFLFTIVFAYATMRYQLHVLCNISLHVACD